jgi:hypothetical protein
MIILPSSSLQLPACSNTQRVRGPTCTGTAKAGISRHPCFLILMAYHVLQAWSDCVSFGDFESYRDRFERIQSYFAPRFPDAVKLGNEMMKTILEKTTTGS